jgi:hypothetical protein
MARACGYSLALGCAGNPEARLPAIAFGVTVMTSAACHIYLKTFWFWHARYFLAAGRGRRPAHVVQLAPRPGIPTLRARRQQRRPLRRRATQRQRQMHYQNAPLMGRQARAGACRSRRRAGGRRRSCSPRRARRSSRARLASRVRIRPPRPAAAATIGRSSRRQICWARTQCITGCRRHRRHLYSPRHPRSKLVRAHHHCARCASPADDSAYRTGRANWGWSGSGLPTVADARAWDAVTNVRKGLPTFADDRIRWCSSPKISSIAAPCTHSHGTRQCALIDGFCPQRYRCVDWQLPLRDAAAMQL